MDKMTRGAGAAAAGNAFTDSFLERLDHRDESVPGSDEATFAGDWQVRREKSRFLLLRDFEQVGEDVPPCWFTQIGRANLAVAALAAAARDPLFEFGQETRMGHFPIVLLDGGDHPAVVGESRLFHDSFLAYLHAMEILARNPRAFAHVGLAMGGDALRIAGRILNGGIEDDPKS